MPDAPITLDERGADKSLYRARRHAAIPAPLFEENDAMLYVLARLDHVAQILA